MAIDKLVVTKGNAVEKTFTAEEIKQRQLEEQNYVAPTIAVDNDKVAMAEAIIDLETRLSVLEEINNA